MFQPPRSAIASLLAASFLVALGYGVLLPVLPAIVARLDTGAPPGVIIWHTGLVTASYAGAALIVAPLWGRLSDRQSNSWMIVVSLVVTGAATIAGAFATDLLSLYFWRFVAGAGAGAIGPATQAWLGRWDAAGASWRTRRVVLLGLASTAGLFVGPFVGGLAATIGVGLKVIAEPALQLPFLSVGVLLLAAALTVAATARLTPPRQQAEIATTNLLGRISFMLVPLAITALAVGSFEVALSFMARDEGMSPFGIGLLFAQCTLFMFAAQSLLVLPRFRGRPMKPLVLPALLIMTAGLAAMTFASGTGWHVVATSLVAVGGGLLPPVLAREIAAIDGGASGAANGFQSAASQAGQTAGAVFASAIAAMAAPRWSFAAAAIIALATGLVLIRSRKWTEWKGTAPRKT